MLASERCEEERERKKQKQNTVPSTMHDTSGINRM